LPENIGKKWDSIGGSDSVENKCQGKRKTDEKQHSNGSKF
jgi:hypothetical protein